jgi:hypothetical protein
MGSNLPGADRKRRCAFTPTPLFGLLRLIAMPSAPLIGILVPYKCDSIQNGKNPKFRCQMAV